MGVLDDAIREHLDLKRRRGADPSEVQRAEREALGPVRREPGKLPDAGLRSEESLAFDYEAEPQGWDESSTGSSEHFESPLAPEPAFEPTVASEDVSADERRVCDEPFAVEEPPSRASAAEGAVQPPTEDPPDPVEPPAPPGAEDVAQPPAEVPSSRAEAAESSVDAGAQPAAEASPGFAEAAAHLAAEASPGSAEATAQPPTEAPRLRWRRSRPSSRRAEAAVEPLAEGAPEHPTETPPPHAAESHPERAAGSVTEPPAGDETAEYRLDHEGEDHEANEDEDVLEETPEFLQDTPEHDRLWFEQRPPRDFDFEG